MTKTIFTRTLFAAALCSMTGTVQAAAFQLAEVSTSGLGRAYAGEAAIADNASVVATNPALMTLFKENQFSAGGVYVDSNIRVNGSATTPLGSVNADNNDVVPGAFIPNMYFVSPINDKFAIGAGMNVNFGLKSEYNSDYSAGAYGGKTELSTINLNLSGAYRIIEGLSFGAGVNAIYAQAKVERTAGVLGQFLGVSSDTPIVRLEDKNAWGFGWNAGLLYEFNERNRIGVAYHSKVDITFRDRNALSYNPYRVRGYVGDGELTLNLPAYLEVSGFHQFNDYFAMHYSYKYTQWSRFKELDANYNNGLKAFHKEEQYRDNSRIALGASYFVNDKLTLRAGIGYDEAAVTKTHASASIPDTDRTWYSLGATYKATPNLSIDLGFSHLRGKKVTFTEKDNPLLVVTYTSKSSANLYGLNVNYSF